MFHQDNDYQQAADQLYKAMKGMGTDEAALIAVSCRFNSDERVLIANRFISTYGDSVEKWFSRELSGNLKRLFLQLYTGRFTQWAVYIHDSIYGAGTDEKLLIEMVFLLNDQAQELVSNEYRRLYNQDMTRMIEKDISVGWWAKLLRAWLHAKNDSQAPPEQIADALYKAAKGAGTDEQTIMNILTNCHPNVYHEACDVFQKKYGKTVEKMITSEFSGKAEDAFLAAHFTLYDFNLAIARYIKMAYKGMGTDEAQLIRMTVLFSDRLNGEELKRAYLPYGDVVKDTKRDLSGKFEKAILAMWGLQ